MASPSHQAPASRPERFGRYLLLDRIAVGGMAEVFRGRVVGVEGFKRMIALKRILPGIAADPEFVEMFVREAKIAETIKHANVATVEELGFCDGSYFIAMEYVSGVSLRTMWDNARQRGRLLPIAMSCHIIQKMCEGLDAAHNTRDELTGEKIGLVHRDVSPQNILVSFEGEVKVIDFGIAKAANQVSKTQAGVLKGKFGYMSPEQVSGMGLDNRSDIFACGTILYELMVGDRLFIRESDFATLECVRRVEMVPPRRINPNLCKELESIIIKALAKNRERRYRRASEMAEDLQRYLYNSDQNVSRQDLQQYMQQYFQMEITEERTRLSAYRNLESNQGIAREEEATEYVRVYTDSIAGSYPKMISPSQKIQSEEVECLGTIPGVLVHPPAFSETINHLTPTDSGRVGIPTWAAVLLGALLTLLFLALGNAVYFRKMLFSPVGELLVEFEPTDASVLLDDRLVAKGSPVTLSDLSVGMYVVTVRRSGYQDAVRPVHISRGQASSIALALQARPRSGQLSVYTKPPGLDIWLDGEAIGKKTPIELSQLPVGEHELALYRPDGSLVRRRKVHLHPGVPERIDLRVDRLPPQLQVVSRPSGAQVRINGLLRGITPLNVEDLEPGLANVEVRLPSCELFQMKKHLDPGAVSVVSAELTCSQ
ncbi:MAG: PEGA domain-containing protein [Myxococcales bacterium]|nr:PEGA domain-containing protein [Myxococcales bacterium]